MWRTVVKYVIYSINLVFVLIGLAVIALAAALHFKIKDLTAALSGDAVTGFEDLLKLMIYVLIAFGLIVFFISFSGCCGACTELKCLLITYSVILGILAALKLAGGVVLFVNDYKSMVENKLTDTFKNDNYTFYGYEKIFECCGLNSSNDYDFPNNLVPVTCCAGEKLESVTCDRSKAYPDGCKSKIGNLVGLITRDTGITLVVIMALEFALMGAAIYLTVTKKPKQHTPEEPKPKEPMHTAHCTVQ